MGRVFRPSWTDADGKRHESRFLHIERTNAQGATRHKKAGFTEAQIKAVPVRAEADALAEKNGLPGRRAANPLAFRWRKALDRLPREAGFRPLNQFLQPTVR